MAVLIGSTGFVGGHLARGHEFELSVHRPNLHEATGVSTDLLVCAGLPAEKWRANRDPSSDWENVQTLVRVMAKIRATTAVLISTVDVYQPARGVDERVIPDFGGIGAYGRHRAWFEAFFRYQFPRHLIVRLPGLFASDLRKNFVFDLMHGRRDQWEGVSPHAQFQFFDANLIWSVIERACAADLDLLNVSVEPVSAQEVASIFGVKLSANSDPILYDMRSVHYEAFGGANGYLFNKSHALSGIRQLLKGRP